MRVFLDTSVLISAIRSSHGASAYIVRNARHFGWTLIVSRYVLDEIHRNLIHCPEGSVDVLRATLASCEIIEDVLTLDRVAVVRKAKDRPVLFTAFATSEVLLTLDEEDFAPLGPTFYGLLIRRPGQFLLDQRIAGTPIPFTAPPPAP